MRASTIKLTPQPTGFNIMLPTLCGRVGVGEAVAMASFGTTQAELERGLARMAANTLPRFACVTDIDAWAQQALHEAKVPAPAIAGIELAMLDAIAQLHNTSIAKLLNPACAPDIKRHELVHTASDAKRAVRQAATHLKVKIARIPVRHADIVENAALHVEEIHAAAPHAQLRVDANAMFVPVEASRFIQRVAHVPIDFLEQPVAHHNIEAFFAHAPRTIPIALDESLAIEHRNVAALIDAYRPEVVMIKPAFVGGLLAGQRTAHMTIARGVRTVVTHALEGPVGRSGALALARALLPVGLDPVGGLEGAQLEPIIRLQA